MKISLRYDESSQRHTAITVFINGKNTGKLVFGTEDVGHFDMIVRHGCLSGLDEFNSSGYPYPSERAKPFVKDDESCMP